MLQHLVAAGYAQRDLALADKGGDVCCGEEDERDGQVFDERNVQAVVTVERDVGAFEHVEGGLVETALWGIRGQRAGQDTLSRDLLLGTAKSRRSFRLARMSEMKTW